MKKKLLSFCIVIFGIILVFIKYNAFDIWTIDPVFLGFITVSSTLLCLCSIVLFNIKNQNFQTGNNHIANDVKSEALNFPAKVNFDGKLKYYLAIGIPLLVLSTYLGFRQKTINSVYVLNRASKKSAKWQRDDYLASEKAKDGFFDLTGYQFNLEVFLATFLIILILAFVIRNTIYYEKIRTYLKSIKRVK
tara:strand:+ start:33704 stop:34276 length:573 start_codon:yes stop_codon:yes gene_type:complete